MPKITVSKGQQYLYRTDLRQYIPKSSQYLYSVAVMTEGNTAYVENLYCYANGIIATFNTSDTFAFDICILYI